MKTANNIHWESSQLPSTEFNQDICAVLYGGYYYLDNCTSNNYFICKLSDYIDLTLFDSDNFVVAFTNNYTWFEADEYCKIEYNASLANNVNNKNIKEIYNILDYVNIINHTFWINRKCRTMDMDYKNYCFKFHKQAG